MERRRIARDLHDGFGQDLALVAVELEQLLEVLLLPDGAQDRLRHVLDRVRHLLGQARELARDLHPRRLEVLGLAASLRLLGREIEHRWQVKVEVVLPGTAAGAPDRELEPETVPELDEILSREVAVEIYRIAQEALANAGRHARVERVRLALERRDDRILLTVEDRGVGFRRGEVEGRGGLGLVSIEERARAVGGEARISSRLGRGTRVRASFASPASDAGRRP